jgi:Mg2+ and Co2+ transporter CorA
MNNVIPVNYPALQYIEWFESDYRIVKVNCDNIFKGGYDKTSDQFQALLEAAYNAIFEIEDDITKIKEFLAAYTSLNNN